MCIFNLIYYHDRLVSYPTLLHKNFAKFIFLSCTIFTYFANIRSTHKLNLFTTLFIFWLCYCSTVCWAHLSINVTLKIFQNSIKLLILFVHSTFDSIEKILCMESYTFYFMLYIKFGSWFHKTSFELKCEVNTTVTFHFIKDKQADGKF